MNKTLPHSFFPSNQNEVIALLGKDLLIQQLTKMLTIRNFEIRAESAYQQGKIGGFFHSYIGQEAIQVAAVQALGQENWYITSYRCHALALLLGATPEEIMAELYGKATGNARGRGGSMHLYAKRLLGGFGIVAGQVPIATGAAFQVKYSGSKNEVAICFLGDGAVAQGAVHESLNLASLWSLPCIYVIENNLWGMGTAVDRALAFKRLAEDIASTYNIKAYTLDGMDFFNCYAGFSHVYEEVIETGRPVLLEVLTERFRGHSISDPGLYRTKEQLQKSMQRDPIFLMRHALEEHHLIDSEEFKKIDKECREQAIAAMKYAEESPWPNPLSVEEDVFAPS
ncbi:pyruvate dehydrogenase (acetyl-transferring) E1 component subunit alpha [Parachlamydia sp. AcF125]|uniref:pyruvate dehydrogenase (acetyl-transferring) E1 component subunit alpha n=1 Tax=Parachlamydia sp. AcF125 TaxID=2795736 RepID=UPI001BCA5D43|nr:Acetoin:2,6-dichlorophenolindophenol oxidoreductase subunit alpha [Parachlamydia sp. AcF125]